MFWLPCIPYCTNIKCSRKFLCCYEFKDNLNLSEKHLSSFLMHRSVLVPFDFYVIKYWIVFCVHSNSFQLKTSIVISFIQKCCLYYWIFMKSNFGIHSSYTVIQFSSTSPLLFQINRNVDVSLHFYEIKYRYPFLELSFILSTFDSLVYYFKRKEDLDWIKLNIHCKSQKNPDIKQHFKGLVNRESWRPKLIL